MGVTKGGILVPSPLSYDYETAGIVSGFTYLICSASSVIRIVTRVPCNARIDDFEAFYAVLRSKTYTAANFTIKVTNLRTSQVLSTSSHSVSIAAFIPYRYDISKGNELLPGDPIEVLITRTSGDELWMRTWQKGTFFSSGTLVGQAFPSASDSVTRFSTPTMFFSWLDSDDAALVEWMPGLLPADMVHGSTSDARAFVGNLITMPFADRQPSGMWLRSQSAGQGFRASIYREPTGSSDFTELYSVSYPSGASNVANRILYLPFDGAQPILERGKSYVVGVGEAVGLTIANKIYYSSWNGSSYPFPWQLDPVYSGFSLLAEAREVIPLGAWTVTVRKRFEIGLVFEESET